MHLAGLGKPLAARLGDVRHLRDGPHAPAVDPLGELLSRESRQTRREGYFLEFGRRFSEEPGLFHILCKNNILFPNFVPTGNEAPGKRQTKNIMVYA